MTATALQLSHCNLLNSTCEVEFIHCSLLHDAMKKKERESDYYIRQSNFHHKNIMDLKKKKLALYWKEMVLLKELINLSVYIANDKVLHNLKAKTELSGVKDKSRLRYTHEMLSDL